MLLVYTDYYFLLGGGHQHKAADLKVKLSKTNHHHHHHHHQRIRSCARVHVTWRHRRLLAVTCYKLLSWLTFYAPIRARHKYNLNEPKGTVNTKLLYTRNMFMTESSHRQRLAKKLIVRRATVTLGTSKLNWSWRYLITFVYWIF